MAATILLVGLGTLIAPARADAATAACPDTIGPAGFSDVVGLDPATVAAIDCLAHYGVTSGTGAGLYQPGARVPRWQMALFLVRTVASLGVGLPDGTGTVFADLGTLPVDVQVAIARLARLGITSGIGSGLFGPFDEVPRWQMAVFLMRLLAKKGVGLPDGSTQGFTDLGGLSADAVKAVNQARQLGVAAGTTSTTFDPHGLVTRGDMAAFLARTLNVAGGRHVRISLSLSTAIAPVHGAAIATVTVTKPNGQPYPGLLVDVFATQGLAVDGTCLVDVDAALNGSDGGTSKNCTIDVADPMSNSSGQVTVGLAHSLVSETDTIWAWTAAAGHVFDIDLVLDRVSAALVWTPTADGLVMSADQELVFGGPASVTAQLTGTALSGQTIRFAVLRNGSLLLTSATITNSSGAATLVYAGPADPSAGDDPTVADEVIAYWDRNRNGFDDGVAEYDSASRVTWDEVS